MHWPRSAVLPTLGCDHRFYDQHQAVAERKLTPHQSIWIDPAAGDHFVEHVAGRGVDQCEGLADSDRPTDDERTVAASRVEQGDRLPGARTLERDPVVV